MGGAAVAGIVYVDVCGDDAWSGTDPTCAGPNGPKRTVQGAIIAAADGDEIVVAPGTYNGGMNFNGA